MGGAVPPIERNAARAAPQPSDGEIVAVAETVPGDDWIWSSTMSLAPVEEGTYSSMM